MEQSTKTPPAAQPATQPSPATTRSQALALYMDRQGRANAISYVLLVLDDVQAGLRPLEHVIAELRAAQINDQAAADQHFQEATRVSL